MRYQTALAAFLLLAGLATAARAQSEVTIHTFLGKADGSFPHGVAVSSGAVYVPTAVPGTGRVFKFTPSGGGWTKTDIQHYTAALGTDPGTLIADDTGALYGVTTHGGPGLCNNGRPVPKVVGCGTVYKLTPPTGKNAATKKWTRTVLYNFTNTGDGFFPTGRLLRDASGTLYGVTQSVPITGPCTPTCGGVFQLTPPGVAGGAWTQRLLYGFTSILEGGGVNDELAMDADGVLYGTTRYGGPGGTGTVYSLTPPAIPGGNWTKATVHNFGPRFSGGIGENPQSGVIIDASGALYGAAGNIYKLTPAGGGAWTPSIISSGCAPLGGLLADRTGQLFGASVGCGVNSAGTVFKLTAPATSGDPWIRTVLYSFTGAPPDTGNPDSTLVADQTGTLYGSISGLYSPNGQSGAVFAISNSGFAP
jgi:uncharacterized repeat protein (TIGR03803 family)